MEVELTGSRVDRMIIEKRDRWGWTQELGYGGRDSIGVVGEGVEKDLCSTDGKEGSTRNVPRPSVR